MEKQHTEKTDRDETREIEVETAETKGLEVVEIDRVPLTDLNFGF